MCNRLAACLLGTICACAAGPISAQTTSALLEWQYHAGIALEKLLAPKVPRWDIVGGLGASTSPAYSGASQYRAMVGPVIIVRYRDRAFLSSVDGLGLNFLEGRHYRIAVTVGLDLGRRVTWHYAALHGLGDIPRAPYLKLSGSYVVSRRLPITLRADIRRIAGGSAGIVGDIAAYLPLPGSSDDFVMLAGPSVTLADRKHLQTCYGISPLQASHSRYPPFAASGGLQAAGVGFSATRFFTTHWLGNANAAVSWLLDSPARSPIVERKAQVSLTLAAAYRW